VTVLVTGGAGFIGAHVVRMLHGRGEEVVVVDDVSTGLVERVAGFPVVRLDLGDPGSVGRLTDVARSHGVESAVHLAARKQVGESVQRPAWYYLQNVGGTAHLLSAMEAAGVGRLVFSSSAATYGQPDTGTVTEDGPTNPINPYGETKLVGEWLVRDATRAWGLSQVSLRYFNVAGAGWPDLGDTAVLNLIPIVLDRLAHGQPPVVFGDDYPTPDGTCVRDYVHVLDLAEAHLAALDHLREGSDRPFDTFNVGTGAGSSVAEVVAEVGRITGLRLNPEVARRRPGDPAALVADVSRINDVLGWRARHGLPEIVKSAIAAHP
jgi:UDP-glucose 4-epimerase